MGADQLTLLPDNPLTWTSVAYVLWDEIDPGEPFPAEQKKALVDWIHWGGQLIISGPDSLDLLKGSFLDPYLPATNGGTRKFDAADKDLAELSNSWMISTQSRSGRTAPSNRPWSGDQTQPATRRNRLAKHRRPVRRTPGRPRPHRRFRHSTFRARLHQLAFRLRKLLQRLPAAPAAAKVLCRAISAA